MSTRYLVLAALVTACTSSSNPPAAPQDASADAAADAAGSAAQNDAAPMMGAVADGASGATCTGPQPHCGPCDNGGWSSCVNGAWVCEGGHVQLGCECYNPPTMGLQTCCPNDPTAHAMCTVPDGGAGKYGSGTPTCANGQTPYVKDAGGTCP